jgi:hypothetical protein
MLGTYFPPQPRFGRPSFRELCEAMASAFKDRRADAEDNALALVDGLARVDQHYRRSAVTADPEGLKASLVISAGRQLAERCDPQFGGLGGAPKFPSSSSHDLLARAGRFPLGEPAKGAFIDWARGMSEGGIYDQLGGGFARYSVDAKWLVPHFEKMLYDQAQLLGIFATLVQLTQSTRAKEIIGETIAFLERELSDKAGGLWSSLDADSEGQEGKFYTWTPAQLRDVLGPVDAMIFAQAYGVTDAGNFEHTRTSVLSRLTPRVSTGEEDHLAELRAKLFAARAARVRPGTDDKVLSGWNGLAITGLVAAWRATGLGLPLALRAGAFLRDRMIERSSSAGPRSAAERRGESIERSTSAGPRSAAERRGESIDGARIRRVHHKDLDGTLEDYAFCAAAFLDLAEATGDAAWWELGARLAGEIRARFVETGADDKIVVFYLAPAGDPLLVHRPESHHDAAIPSGAAIAVSVLVRLGLVAGDEAALALAETYLVQRLTGATGVDAWGTSALLAALDRYLHGQTLVVTDGEGRDALLAAARAAYAPALSIAGPWAARSILDGKSPDGATARAYLCTGPTCSLPVREPAALLALLSEAWR